MVGRDGGDRLCVPPNKRGSRVLQESFLKAGQVPRPAGTWGQVHCPSETRGSTFLMIEKIK